MESVRRGAAALLGVALILLTVVAQQRLTLVFIRLTRFGFGVLVAIWVLPLLVAVSFMFTSRIGRSLFAHIRSSAGRETVWILVVLAYVSTLIPVELQYSLTITRLALTNTGAIMLIWALLPVFSGRRFDAARRFGTWLVHDLQPLPFLAMTAGLVFVAANLASWLVFQHMPHAEDSIGQVFQGRIFASGRLWLPARFDDYFFSYFQIINDGQRVYDAMPFGHSLLLALGSLIHAEWLVHPLLGAAEIIVLYLLGKEIYDEKTGRFVALLGTASPFLLFMSSEYMNHASALLFISLFLLFFVRTLRSERQGRGKSHDIDPLVSGLCLAFALNIRPLTALAFALPAAVCGAFVAYRSRGRLLRPFVLMLFLVILGVGAMLLYNYLTTGSLKLTGYEAYGILQYRHPGFGVGFGDRGYPIWPGPHTPLRGLTQTLNNFVALNRYLFEGPVPGLILVLLLFLTLTRRRADYFLLATFVALPVAYFFYYFQALCFGPRLLYEGLAPLLLLIARGLIEFPRFVGRVVDTPAGTQTRRVVLTSLAVSLCFTCVVAMPRLIRTYGSSYRGVDDRIHHRVAASQISQAVVFVQTADPISYGGEFLNNDLSLNAPVVYARDRGDLNYLLMRRFPGRTCYRATPDTLYRVANTDSMRSTPTIQALAEAGSFVSTLDRSDYRAILLPCPEAAELVDTTGLRCHTYRNLDYALYRSGSTLSGYAPALAVFLTGDDRQYSARFEPMRECRDYVAGGCRFTLRFRSENGRCAVYEVEPSPTEGKSIESL